MIRDLNHHSRSRCPVRGRVVRTTTAAVACCLMSFGAVFATAAPIRPKQNPPPVVHSERPAGPADANPRDVADLRAIEARIEPIVDRVRQCTVGIIVGEAQGSGVIVSERGLVLTAAHVVMTSGRKVTVVLSDGKHLEARALGVNLSTDCGAVQVTESGPFPACKLSDLSTLRVGDWCLATGHPGGYQEGRTPVMRLGRIVESLGGMLQSDCPLLGGDSGGPLFDLNGNVIAIHSRIGARTSLNLHVPTVFFLRDWDRLTTVGVPRVVDTDSTSMLGIDGQDDPKGARVTLVFPGSPASDAGLRSGDVITTFDGKAVAGFQALQKLIGARRPGDIAELRILRNQNVRQLQATIAARPGE